MSNTNDQVIQSLEKFIEWIRQQHKDVSTVVAIRGDEDTMTLLHGNGVEIMCAHEVLQDTLYKAVLNSDSSNEDVWVQ